MPNQPFPNKPHIVAYDVHTGKVTVRCTSCKDLKMTTVRVDQEQMESWLDGMLIQNAMPQLNGDERELLISGTCGKCWDDLFGPPIGRDYDPEVD